MEDGSLELFAPSEPAGAEPPAPLANRMRPRSFDEVVGQDALVGPGAPLRTLAEGEALPSLILWGPPGSGKTTLARLLAFRGDASDRDGPATVRFVALSAVLAGVKEVRAVVERAARDRSARRQTVLFVDEIHRFNRAQQDALLPHVERGTITLIGATTENPSFEVVAPLLSRCRVFLLERLDLVSLAALVRRAAADPERGLGRSGYGIDDEAIRAIAEVADGDARRALGLLEAAFILHAQAGAAPGSPVPVEMVRRAAGARTLVHDRAREEHYNVTSALIKSLRASDPDAAIYYLTRLLEAGDDPLFVARRLVIFASEDVGNADPEALCVATAAHLAVERIGLPEGRIPLAQAVTYLACAPKSRASYDALGRATEALARTGSLPVPLHLRNAPTPLMKELGYGRAAPPRERDEDADGRAPNLPEALRGARFYEPGESGTEPVSRRRRGSGRPGGGEAA